MTGKYWVERGGGKISIGPRDGNWIRSCTVGRRTNHKLFVSYFFLIWSIGVFFSHSIMKLTPCVIAIEFLLTFSGFWERTLLAFLSELCLACKGTIWKQSFLCYLEQLRCWLKLQIVGTKLLKFRLQGSNFKIFFLSEEFLLSIFSYLS